MRVDVRLHVRLHARRHVRLHVRVHMRLHVHLGARFTHDRVWTTSLNEAIRKGIFGPDLV